MHCRTIHRAEQTTSNGFLNRTIGHSICTTEQDEQ